MSDELDVCPFCGATPLLNEIAPHTHNLTIGGVKFPDHPGSWTIECPACECGMIAGTKEAVTVAWNRRAQPAEEVQPVALKTHGAWDGLEALDSLPDGTALYTRPPAADAETVRKAARYDFLRECNSGSLVIVQIIGTGDNDEVVLTEADADAAIDAALAASKEKKE